MSAGTLTAPPAPPAPSDGSGTSRVRAAATAAAVPLLAVMVGLAVGAVLIVLAGGSPLEAYGTMLDAALGGDTQLGRLLTGMTPLVLMGLGYAVAYRTGFVTIGAQGHYDVGAITATAVVLGLPLGSSWLAIPVVAVTAAAAGALVGAVAGVLKARLGVNEIISSLMLNYLVFYGLAWAVRKPLANPNGFTPESERIPEWAQLAAFPGTTVCALAHGGRPLAELELGERTGWILGAEGPGVSAALAALATQRATISLAAGTESLNVAAAAAILFYERARRRAPAT